MACHQYSLNSRFLSGWEVSKKSVAIHLDVHEVPCQRSTSWISLLISHWFGCPQVAPSDRSTWRSEYRPTGQGVALDDIRSHTKSFRKKHQVHVSNHQFSMSLQSILSATQKRQGIGSLETREFKSVGRRSGSGRCHMSICREMIQGAAPLDIAADPQGAGRLTTGRSSW